MAKRPVQLDNRGYRKFGVRDKFAYAAGDFGLNMNLALNGLAKTFWSTYMLVQTGLLFTLILLAVQLWDLVNEPLIGSIIDRDQKRYRRGKFKQYIFLGACGLLLSAAVLFLPLDPAKTAVWLKAVIFLVGYILWDAFFTFASIPYGALISQITTDARERAQLSVWRAAGTVVGTLLPNVLLPMLIWEKVKYNGTGLIPDVVGVHHNRPEVMGGEAYAIGDVMIHPFTGEKAQILLTDKGLTTALIMSFVGLIALLFMLKRVTVRVDAPMIADNVCSEKCHGFKAFGRFMKNRPALGATIAAMGVILGMNAAVTANAIVFSTYFGMAKWNCLAQLLGYVPMIVLMPFIPKIVDRFGKKEASVIGGLVSFVGAVILFVFPVVGKDIALIVYLLGLSVFSIGMGVYFCVSWAMMGDAIDYNEWKFGTREESSVFALHSFFGKLAQKVSNVVVLLLMMGMGYLSHLGTLGQNPATTQNMCWLVAGLYMVSAVFQLIGLALVYNLDKNTLEQMNAELAERRR